VKLKTGLIFFGLSVSYLFLAAQPAELNAAEWAKLLSSKRPAVKEDFRQLDSILVKTDSATCFRFINELENKGNRNNEYFIARFNCLKSFQLYQKNYSSNLETVTTPIKQLFASALNKAYETGDKHLVAFVSIYYGGLVYNLGETELAVMYLMNGVELNEEIAGANKPFVYQSLGDLLFRIKEYKNSIYYSLKAVQQWEADTSSLIKGTLMSCLNTVALGYHRLGVYDSAFLFYNKALLLAQENKNDVWQGIIRGNMGQIYFAQKRFDSALAYLQIDYRTSKAAGYYDNAGNSLQWVARTKLTTGDQAGALTDIREAIQLLNKWPVADYFRNIYRTATEIFTALSKYDSALHYHQLYAKLNDSLERVASLSSIAISRARLNDERSRYSIENLQHEKKEQLVQRNIFISGILLLSVIALLIVNRQRLRSILKTEKLMKEKEKMEQEISSAREQLNMFTENIIEKTSLIEKLEAKVVNNHLDSGQQMIIDELSSQTILTEEEWLKFKNLFEKIHPGFFTRLKEKANDISIGEQRMAALARLQLSINQMAAMLGITADSVRKNRTRLKQRIGLAPEDQLDDFINKL
jgi:tetratricopeptide (TPR) repeat protein